MNDDMPNSHLADKVDSTFAKAWARWVWPVLMAVLGFLIVDKLRDIQSAQTSAREVAQEFATEMSQVNTRVALLNARLDDRVIRQVDALTSSLAEHEKRIQTLERTVKTP